MSTKEIGHWGEDMAIAYLQEKGYLLLERNWHRSGREIDIICEKDNLVLFVEVKTRKKSDFGLPEDYITEAQIDRLLRAAGDYCEDQQLSKETRFDVIAIRYRTKEDFELRHLEDAIYEGF